MRVRSGKRVAKGMLSMLLCLSMLGSATGCCTIMVNVLKDDETTVTPETAAQEDPYAGIEVDEELSFAEFCDEMVTETLSESALNAHFTVTDPSDYGVTFSEEDYTFGTFSLEDYDTAEEEITGLLAQLSFYDYDSLTEEEQLTYDCLQFYLETELAYVGTYELEPLFAPSSGIIANLSTNFVEFVFYEVEDVEEYFLYMESVPAYMECAYAFTRQQAEDGYFMDSYNVDETIEECDAYLEQEENPYIASFNDKIAGLGLSDEEIAAYEAKNEELVATCITPAYEDTKALLNELYDAGKDQGGLCSYGEIGQKYYAAIVRDKTSTDMTPQEIIDLLDETSYELWDEIVEVANADYQAYLDYLDFTMSSDVTAMTYTEDSMPYDMMEWLIDGIRGELPGITASADFPAPVTENYVIEYQNPACEIEGTIAYYLTARIDDISRNSIKVNGSEVEGNDYMLYTTLAHEGYPGHLYQFTSFYANASVPDVRKLLDFIGSTEGWAEYAADQAVSYLGLGASYTTLATCDDLLNYVIDSRIDLGVNYEGWGVDDVAEYLSEYYGDAGEEYAEMFYYSVTADAGLLLPYTIGHILMNDLRAEAEEELGDDFSAYEFHQQIIEKIGIAPFTVYEDRIDEWIEEKLSL